MNENVSLWARWGKMGKDAVEVFELPYQLKVVIEAGAEV
jgi:hypothetical protein